MQKTGMSGALLALLLLVSGCAGNTASSRALPPGFVHLADVAPQIRQDMRYAGSQNFIGRPIKGYLAPTCILTQPAAQALAAVQAELEPQGLGLKVYDCYRPQQAVDDFVAWGRDLTDQKSQAEYYPRVPKAELFQRGYIAAKSGHSRGSTMDLTVVVLQAQPGQPVEGQPLADGEVDMGSPFDLFDERSHTDYAELPATAVHNRQWFRALMQRHGFRNLPEEWWHFTLVDEPWPARYFDFPVR